MAEDPWNIFNATEDYRRWIETPARHQQFSFRVGVFGDHRFYFDQHGHFFQSFVPEAPTDKKADAKTSVLGIHVHNGLNLSAEYLYEQPKDFVRQGDIFEHKSGCGFPELADLTPSHWVAISQTCTVDHGQFSSVVPAFFEDQFLKMLTPLGVKPPNPADAIRNNRKPRLLSLPPTDELSEDSNLILDLEQVYSMSSSKLKSLQAALSLTLPGNAYLSSRMAMSLFRDVKDWDDQRKIR